MSGAGGGGFLYYLRNAGYRSCRGIDISDEQIRLALDRGIRNIEKGDLRVYLKAHPSSFKLIIAQDILEHFHKEEIINISKLIYNALVPGGRCIIQTVNAESPFSMGYRYGDISHETCFTRLSLESVLRMGGFSNLRFSSVRPVCRYSCLSAARCILWQGTELLLRAYNLIETGSPAGIFTRNLIAIAEK